MERPLLNRNSYHNHITIAFCWTVMIYKDWQYILSVNAHIVFSKHLSICSPDQILNLSIMYLIILVINQIECVYCCE